MEDIKKIGYKDLLDLCAEFGLNPDKRGGKTLDKSKFFILGKEIQKEGLLFPGDNEKEIFEIGRILNNLLSQTLSFPSYTFVGQKDREQYMNDILIKELQCIFEQLILFYLCKEIKADGYLVCYGITFRIEPDEEVVMAKARQQVEELRKRGKIFFDQKERDKNFSIEISQDRA